MTTTLAPMAWTMFTQRPAPTRAEWIAIVNRAVNDAIGSAYGTPAADDPWKLWPEVGWCHDYAITKYYELKLHGIASQLCECIAPDGEHHMVVLVDGIVLDNLTSELRPMAYQVVRTQSLANPDVWELPG
jgi:predicted transglutaminase-like cysteine proteinase